MNAVLLGYRLDDEIFRSVNTLVYRAHREVGEERVILKVIRELRPSPRRIAAFRREFELLEQLRDVPGIVRSHGFGHDNGRWAMSLEENGGVALRELVRDKPMPLEEALRVAERLAGTLADMHRNGVIHKDVNPSNVVYNRGTGQLRLIDFGIATVLTREESRFDAALAQHGTLAYTSPEQTGRLNREVDYRTDLYSLGATLYHLLTGHPPFQLDDPIELVHAHIARVPDPPKSAVIPEVVSQIAMRLLAKAADERYQSAGAVQMDLAECSRQLRETGRVRSFELDRTRRPINLVLPQRLYGREAEVETLVEAYRRTAIGPAEVLIVAGYSGVGKSALVQELYAPVTEHRGQFIAGKFDQFKRDVPFDSLAQAIRSLLQQVLGRSESVVANWRADISEALGTNGQVLIDVIPELVHIIGPQPAVPELPPAEAEVRFDHVFMRFVAAIAQPSRPLALFLDDMQWVDPGSLRLLESLLRNGDLRHLLLVLAFRDNEVAPGHPLLLMLDRVRHAGTRVSQVKLAPLGFADVQQLILDTVQRAPHEIESLAKLIYGKTEGNPFFLRQFLRSLYSEKLLVLEDRWTWDIHAIAARNITDNVVELMAEKLRAMPPHTQIALRYAGALGGEIDVAHLVIASEVPAAKLCQWLWPAVVDGLLLPVNDAYALMLVNLEAPELSAGDDAAELADSLRLRFAHDRIQQAAYGLWGVEERSAAHWAIGTRFQAAWKGPALEEHLFAVLGHLISGRAHARTAQQQRDLAVLCHRGARKAKASAAFAAAREYATLGLELLGPDRFGETFALAMALAEIVVETAYQTGDFALMDKWFQASCTAAHTPLETAGMQEIVTESFNARGQPLAALKSALDYLDLLGFVVPREPSMDDVGAEMALAAAALGGRSADQLARAPEMTDPAVHAAVTLICKIYSSAYVASPLVFILVALKQVQLVGRHGNCAVSPLVYAVYGLLQAGLVNDVRAGYQFGELSSRLLDRPDVARFKAQALHLFSCHTRFWREHLRACADGEREAWRVGLETGEMEFGSYGGHVASKYAFFHGQELSGLLGEIEHYTHAMGRYRSDIAYNSHLPWHQAVLNLAQPCREPWVLRGAVYDHEQARAVLAAANDRMGISNALLASLMLSVIFGRIEEALRYADDGAGFLDSVLSQFNQPVFYFYASLARLASLASCDVQTRAARLELVNADIARLSGWAEAAPMNFAQKVALLQAELARVEGCHGDARDAYDRAIELARQSEFVGDEAIASELAARYCLACGRTVPARHHLQDAFEAYDRWGAATKVAQMEERHPELRAAAQSATPNLQTTHTTSVITTGKALDIESVLRASQAISTEVVLPNLLRTLLTTVMQYAGAEYAVLLLERDGRMGLEAQAHSDDVDVKLLNGQPLESAGDIEVLPLSIAHFVSRTRETLVLDDAMADAMFARDPYVVARRTRSVLCQPVVGHGQLRGAIYLENSLAPGVFTTSRREVVGLLAGQIAVSIDNAKLYENLEQRVQERTEQLETRNQLIRNVFGRYMSDDVVDSLLTSETALALGGERRTVTIMFTDLRGFTATCEHLPPERVVKMLNMYFSVMTRVIHARRGSLQDIMGDGMVIVFGAPIWREDDAERAVACALEMQLAMAEVNAQLAAEDLPQLSMGIGIHTGESIVGNIGSLERAKYSVVGSHVNLASRIESMSIGGQVLISGQTRAAVPHELRIDGEYRFAPKGFIDTVVAYDVGAIGGHFDLELPLRNTTMQPLIRPIAVSIAVVDGKSVRPKRYPSTLTAAGDASVHLLIDEAMEPGTNLLIEMTGADGGVERVYAKVKQLHGEGVDAHVTSDRTGLDAAVLRSMAVYEQA